MKLLGNSWIVGGLCVIAVGVVGYQVLSVRRPAGAAPVPANAAFTPASPAMAPLPQRAADPAHSATRTGQSTNRPALIQPVDRGYARAHFAQWVEAPRRDPFLLPPPPKATGGTNSLVAQWKLKAIWRQTGSRLAAINQGVYTEGEEISGYRIQRIDSDRVWFDGPAGRESLGFVKAPPHGGHPATPTPGH